MISEDRHWLAGLLEGDGSFYLGGRYQTPYICLEMADHELDVVQRAAALMDAPSAKVYPSRAGRFPNGKPTARAQIGGAKAVRVMNEIYRLMGTYRRERIDSILTACDPDGTRYAARQKEEAA